MQFSAFCRRVALVTRWTIFALVAAMFGALALQVVMRYVFGTALSWSEELALGCFTWSSLLAVALGVRTQVHARMDLVLERLGQSKQEMLERFIALLITLFGLALLWAGVLYTLDSRGSVSAAIGYPTWYLYSAAPVTGLLLLVFGLERMLLGPSLVADTLNTSSAGHE